VVAALHLKIQHILSLNTFCIRFLTWGLYRDTGNDDSMFLWGQQYKLQCVNFNAVWGK